MIVLTNPKPFTASLAAAPAVTQPTIVIAYADCTATAITEGTNEITMTGTTPINVVGTPTVGIRRVIKSVAFTNLDTAPATVTLFVNSIAAAKTTVASSSTVDLTTLAGLPVSPAQVATATVMGNNSGVSAVPFALSATATLTLLGIPGLQTSGISGNLTLLKAGVTARNATLPDAAVLVTGSAAALTTNRLPKGTATAGVVQDSQIADTVTGNVLTIAGTLTAVRTVTFPDASVTIPSGTLLTGTLANANRLDSTSAAGVVKESLIADGIVTSVLTLAGTLTVPRTKTIQNTTATLSEIETAETLTGAKTFSAIAVFNATLTTTAARFVGPRSVVTAAGTTTGLAADHFVVFTGATTQIYALPAAAAGRQLLIKNRSTGAVTVNRTGTDTIDGLTTLNVAAGVGITLVANSTDWCVI